MNFNFFKKSHISTPKSIRQLHLQLFPQAINTEWSTIGNAIEALFYLDEIEYIAKYSASGKLESLKKNIRIDLVPEVIKASAANQGELMSAISIDKENEIVFEVIIRKSDLSRHLLFIDKFGVLLEMKAL